MAKFGTTVIVSGGLQGNIYEIRPSTNFLPKFRGKPLGQIYTTELNVPPRDFTEGFPGVTDRFEWFAIDYKGRFWIEQAGVYRFELSSDDGSKLRIDDHVVIDNDGIHPVVVRNGSIQLKRGVHRIRVSYFQGPRFHVALILRVAAPGEPFRIFNTNDFKPPAE